MNRRIRSRGFTLIELMLVLVILGVLALVVTRNLAGRSEQARTTAARADIAAMDAACDDFERDMGHYPSTEEGLRSLIDAPANAGTHWKGPYLKRNEVPKDPWLREYIYRFPASHNKSGPDISSSGLDGQEGTADDVDNWTQK
jgi:general secretion pathway protein G